MNDTKDGKESITSKCKNWIIDNKLSIAFYALAISTTLLIVFAIWYFGAQWVDSKVPTKLSSADIATYAARGQFGDKFGVVNALFSGLAFSGIIITLLLQRSDLNRSRKSAAQEQFDSAFFQLLSLQKNITKGISLSAKNGEDAFEAMHLELIVSDKGFPTYLALNKINRSEIREIIDCKDNKSVLNKFPALEAADISTLHDELPKVIHLESYLDSDEDSHKSKIITAYQIVANKHIDKFSHYFRNLYHLLKYIDESSSIDGKQKIWYAKIVRSQLSEWELLCLFYNSILKYEVPGREQLELGYPKMKMLLIKYDILQNINPKNFIHPIHKIIFYKNGGV